MTILSGPNGTTCHESRQKSCNTMSWRMKSVSHQQYEGHYHECGHDSIIIIQLGYVWRQLGHFSYPSLQREIFFVHSGKQVYYCTLPHSVCKYDWEVGKLRDTIPQLYTMSQTHDHQPIYNTRNFTILFTPITLHYTTQHNIIPHHTTPSSFQNRLILIIIQGVINIMD